MFSVSEEKLVLFTGHVYPSPHSVAAWESAGWLGAYSRGGTRTDRMRLDNVCLSDRATYVEEIPDFSPGRKSDRSYSLHAIGVTNSFLRPES